MCLCVCVSVMLCECAGNVGDRLKQSKKRGGCDDSSSTCCFSHCSSVLAALSRPTPASPAGDDAAFLTSQTQPHSNAKYPSKRLLGNHLAVKRLVFFFFSRNLCFEAASTEKSSLYSYLLCSS